MEKKEKAGMRSCRRAGLLTAYLSFYLAAALYIFPRPLQSLDEIWNFSFGLHAAEGMIPYRDFNMVVTPFSVCFPALLFKLLGGELAVFRFCGTLLCGSVFAFSWRLAGRMGRNRAYMYLLLMLLLGLYGSFLTYDYNFLNLLLLHGIVFLELEYAGGRRSSAASCFWTGFLCGLCIITKQSTGSYVSLAGMLIGLLDIRTRSGDRNAGGYRLLVFRGLGMLVCPLGLCLCLSARNGLGALADYCIGGVFAFRNTVTILEFLAAGWPAVLGLASAAAYLAVWFGRLLRGRLTFRGHPRRCILLLYGLASLLLVIPIFDMVHFYIGAYPVFVMLLYDLAGKIRASGWREKAACIFMVWCLNLSLAGMVNMGGGLQSSGLRYYKGIPIDAGLEEQIRRTDEWLAQERESGREVYILDASASLYFIPLDIYHKNYDMFLRGNLGVQSPEKLAQSLLEQDNVILLPGEGYAPNWQFPDEVLRLIQNSRQRAGSVGIFDIYERASRRVG